MSRSAARDSDKAVDGFSPIVQERIGWYVYLLRDPRDGEVFYIGKGKGNRVFAHARAALAQMALTDEEQGQTSGLKLERIQDIHRSGGRVVTEMLRHKISSRAAAYEVEGAVIDAFRATGRPLAKRRARTPPRAEGLGVGLHGRVALRR